ncbi:MAG: lipase maturation factor family protein [Gammaproteobacteria bacterium]|nr:lipase maturation factor family protein [Gammaproteobacteria bacterium]
MILSSPARPVVVFDGDCGICREWVEYWRALTGGRFEFRPYQEAAPDFPEIAVAEFTEAIQLIEPDGTVASGAEATFQIYRGIAPYSLLPWLYRFVPGFRAVSESAYRFLSRHRGILSFLTHLLWGRDARPARFTATRWVFLRLLGLIYLAAFASFGVQVTGLIGSDGLLAVGNLLDAVYGQFGPSAWVLMPNIFWLASGDAFLQGACIAGVLLALMVVFNVLARVSLVALFLLYLSLVDAGQAFMNFQWDLLLLEAGLLAVFLPTGSRLIPWLYRWLAFRFMFMGGMVKILSRDPTWDNLTALSFHFETQPLPTPAAWFAHHLPDPVLVVATAATLIIELVLPFFIFAPRRMRMFTACAILLLQSLIIVTGNYNFFNLLTIAICVFLFDDAALLTCLPGRIARRLESLPERRPGRAAGVLLFGLATLVIFVSGEQIARAIGGHRSTPVSLAARLIAPCQCVNSYGPFAVMTTRRHEIVIEGSRDGREWKAYEFKYKPGELARITSWITPHQPRLDWQMWFAALSPPDRNPWFRNLLGRLLSGSRPVLALLEPGPFADAPPVAVRARFYRYQFTTSAERRSNGNWWKRELVAEYYPPVHLSGN